MDEEIKKVEVDIKDWLYQIENLSDHVLVSHDCWSKMSLKARLWNYAQMITHGNYVIEDEDKEDYRKLVSALERKRCIVIYGPPGSGKTMLTKIVAKITASAADKERFKFINAYRVTDHFSQTGSEIFRHYTSGNWIFDDVGLEKNTQIRGGGNSYNVFEQLIYTLCENHLNPSIKSRFILSTNLNEDMLLDRYGDRVMSRLKQVVDFIWICKTDHRQKDIRIEAFPEVIHPPKGYEGVSMPEYMKEDFKKLLGKFTQEKKQEARSKPLRPTEFEMLCWDWFDTQWANQGSKRMGKNGEDSDTGTNYIVYEGKKFDRHSFVTYLRDERVKEKKPI